MTPTGVSSSRAALLNKGRLFQQPSQTIEEGQSSMFSAGAKAGAYHCTGGLCYEIDGQPFGLAVVSHSVAATIPCLSLDSSLTCGAVTGFPT